MKINKTKIRNTFKTRRTFLKSVGMAITGIGMYKPLLFIGNKGIIAEDNTFDLTASTEERIQDSISLPDPVKAIWDINKAFREKTPTRERISINGLWQWQPGDLSSDDIPGSGWGYFKVPGQWHNRIGSRNENQTLFVHPEWNKNLPENITVAWYQRDISIPDTWGGRRVILAMEYLNSNAIIYIDGHKAGELWFPGGELDLTSFCKPGLKYRLSIKVKALPLKDVITAYNDSNMARQIEATVERRGLCGDVYLSGIPAGPIIDTMTIDTSVTRQEITFKTGLLNLVTGTRYNLRITITDNGIKIAEFTGKTFNENDLKAGSFTFTEKWIPDKLWDIHTPQNMYLAHITLLNTAGKELDVAIPVRFGYREFRIDGRDFYLNGSRIWLSCIPLDNAQYGAAFANYDGARESLKRLKNSGINFVYTHNYGCEPGTHVSFAEILRAADDTGMLIALSQPHFSQYEWDKPDADVNNGYAHHAAFYTNVARNHPSVVFYSTSHNATGYSQDMNPDLIDGHTRDDSQWSLNNVAKALRAEAIIRNLDPFRIVYHHHSGNLGSMYVCNFYANWVPIQEMNEWFGHWATKGEKPAMLVEFSTPFTWDYGVYRGWYKGVRDFGSAKVPWEFCLAEWNAQFIGDYVYKISEYEKANLRWEAEKFRAGEIWGRSEYPFSFDSVLLDERNQVFAKHFASNWRAFRTWGVSAVNAMWHYTIYWRLLKNVKKGPKSFKTDWENLQRPGLSPDIVNQQRERMDMGYEMSDWEATVAAKAITDNHGPLTAYIGGKAEAFTDKSHNFLQGQSFEKQLIIINNSREKIQCDCNWVLNLSQPITGRLTINLSTGMQERILLNFDLPKNLNPGKYEIKAVFLAGKSKSLTDSFEINVLPERSQIKITSGIALFDPIGDTSLLLNRFGIGYKSVENLTGLSDTEILIIGKGALKADGPGFDGTAVRNGLKVIVFEQTSEVLEQRFGFRVQEYGLRQVFRRISDHPALEGLTEDQLHDWHGEATILPGRLSGAPEFKWCDIPVTRAWRCGNRGNVASVLVEKPACSNFLPLIDGGYSLQYSPLMEYREGKGLVIFCQMDVTGRTETDPAGGWLTWNIISYISAWSPSPNLKALYTGEQTGKAYLEKASIKITEFKGGKILPDQVLIVGPGSTQQLTENNKSIGKFIKAGGRLMTIGIDQPEISLLFPGIVMKKEEHIAASFGPFDTKSPFAGIGPADVHNRSPREISLVSSGASIIGNGVLAKAEEANAVFCQLVPWHFDYSNQQHNVKQTFRRSSFLVNRLLGNLGIHSSTDFLSRLNSPVDKDKNEKRWLSGLYLDEPEEWDDPYRFFRW